MIDVIRDMAAFWYVHLGVWAVALLLIWLGLRLSDRLYLPVWARLGLGLVLSLVAGFLSMEVVGPVLDILDPSTYDSQQIIDDAGVVGLILMPAIVLGEVGAALRHFDQTLWSGAAVVTCGILLTVARIIRQRRRSHAPAD